MRSVLVAATLLSLGGCGAAHGASTPWRKVVLVELFTSQGCSSCPAADAFVRELPALGLGRDRVVPLTFHVDYWDGLGWKDRFARREFTARQEWYARATRLRSPEGEAGLQGLYTPQMVIDGAVHLSGRRRQDAVREMERAAAAAPVFDLAPRVSVQGTSLDVAVDPGRRARPTSGLDWHLRVALVTRRARTPVDRGENAGETLEEAAVVRVLSDPIALPTAAGTAAHAHVTKPDDVPWDDLDVVVFAQAETGAVGAAVQLPAR
jgi:hypothetical protein